MDIQPVIKQVAAIFKAGYLPNRGDELYGKFSFHANCMEHACCNFPNSVFADFSKKLEEENPLFLMSDPFSQFDISTKERAKTEVFQFLKDVGLKVEKGTLKQKLKKNQWRVAVYFSEAYEKNFGRKDFHFLLEEGVGKWSEKRGNSEAENCLSPQKYLPFDLNNRYVLDEILTLTNPYAKGNEKVGQICK